MSETKSQQVIRVLVDQLVKSAEPKGMKVKPGSRKGGKSEPAAKAKPGAGDRFKALAGKLGTTKGVKDTGALAASIGRSKYGKKKFQQMSKRAVTEKVHAILKSAGLRW